MVDKQMTTLGAGEPHGDVDCGLHPKHTHPTAHGIDHYFQKRDCNMYQLQQFRAASRDVLEDFLALCLNICNLISLFSRE